MAASSNSSSTPPVPTTRTLQTGETLLKTGDRVENVYVVQSGRLLLLQARGTQLLEIGQITAPQCFADESVFAPAPRCSVTVMAVKPTAVLQIPAVLIRDQLRSCPENIREFIKALHDRTKSVFTNLRNMRGESGGVPCPGDETAKIFAVLFHCVRIVGTKAGTATADEATADWKEVRRFATDIFSENIFRFECAAQILVRLGLAKIEAAPNQSGEKSESITILQMKPIEEFFEFFGSYHFKSGYENLLKTNPKMTAVTEAFLNVIRAPGSEMKVDRSGAAMVPYKSTIDAMKEVLPGFEADQLFRLEQKGLFIKRQTTNDGGTLQFLPQDFEQMLRNWRILKEVEDWNEKGYIESSSHHAGPSAHERHELRRRSNGTTRARALGAVFGELETSG